MTQRSAFIHGAIILFIAGFINKILGFVYRIFSVRIVGTEGIGLYEMVFPIYTLILVITTAGVPLAISKLVSEQVSLGNHRQVKKIFRVALSFLLAAGALFSIVLLFLTPILVRTIFADPRVYWCLMTLAPAVFIISITSAFRGYFQGLQRMTPPAVSQIIEQIARVAFGVYMASKFLPHGLEFGVAGLAAGTVLGEIFGLVVMLIAYIFHKNIPPLDGVKGEVTTASAAILVSIFSFSIPISLTRLVNSAQLALQAIIIPQRLHAAGYTFRQATEIYGQFSGIALALLSLPSIITFSLVITLVPAISEAAAKKNYKLLRKRGTRAIQISLIAGIPSAVVFFLLPEQLCSIIFNSPGAAAPLKVLAAGSIFLYLAQTTSGILQGLGKVGTQLRNSSVGAVLILAGLYYMTSIPTYGIIGAALAMNMGWAVVAGLNLYSVGSFTGIHLDFRKFMIIPLLGAAAMGLTMYFSFLGFSILGLGTLSSTLGSIAISVLVYLLCLFFTGIINKDVMAQIPGFGHMFNDFTMF